MSLIEKFHKAARDGYIDLLKQGSRRELNKGDEDGMTPVHWAAYSGQLEALRVIVGRGGDPDQADLWGNSALHHAASNNHMNCVSFLTNFGANIWSLDNEGHCALDIAAMKEHEEIVKFLDNEIFRQTLLNPKQSSRRKQRALEQQEKRLKKHHRLMQRQSKSQPDLTAKPSLGVKNLEERLKHTLGLRARKSRQKGNWPHSYSHLVRVGADGRRLNDRSHVEPNVVYGSSFDCQHKLSDSSEPPSLFDRPGFGCVSFRVHGMAEAFKNVGSAESINGTQLSPSVSDVDTSSSSHWSKTSSSSDDALSCLETFLEMHGLPEYFVLFARRGIGLDAVLLLTDEDMERLEMPFHARKVLLDAIERRKECLQCPAPMVDIRL